MQLATERRDPQTMRVPLDDVLINLSPEGFDEYFAADAVNVGVGGLSMRSAILPDVGAKLSCRFQSPHDGSAVNADCEVVWSQAQGSNVGEFGLRFTGMTSQDQESIEQLVYSWNEDLLPSLGPESYGSSPGPQSVRIELDGVGQAVEADVSHRAEDALVVEQKLPFLRVGTGISEGGRRGTLQSVDLRIEDDLPRLVLTIWYDDHSQGGELSSYDRSEDTLMEGSLPGENLSVEIAEPEVAEREASEPGSIHEMKRESATQVRYDADDEVARLSDDEAESIAAQLKPDIRRSLRQAGERLRPLWSRFRALMVTLWVKAGPRVRGIAGRIRTFSALLWARSMGGVKGLWAKARKRSTTQVHSKKRRVQAARRATSGAVETAGTPARRRGAGRLMVGAVLVVGLAAIAASVMGDSGVTAKLVQPKPEPLVDPELGDESFAAEPEAIAPTAAPGEVPAASPYAAEGSDVGSEAAESADRFESGSLDNARSYTLRMSLPPRGVRGQDTEDGIRVVILGSNAIDGARRIASADPRVEAASILNHGEEAELRLRFTDGERPGYRIESRSSTLVISIGD